MTIFPVLQYRDAHAAIDFLERAFGFERKQVHEDDEGRVAHAELARGDDVIMLVDAPARQRVRPHRPDARQRGGLRRDRRRSTRCTTARATPAPRSPWA